MYKVIGIHSKLKIILKCKQFHNHYRHFMGNLSSHKENFRSQWIYQEVLPSILETNNFVTQTITEPLKEQAVPKASDKANISWARKPTKDVKRK